MHRNKFSSVPTWPLTYSMANDKIGEERGWGRGRGRGNINRSCVSPIRFYCRRNEKLDLRHNEQLVYIVDKSLLSFAVISSWGEKIWPSLSSRCLFVINNAALSWINLFCCKKDN